MFSFSGLASGLDTAAIIQQLVSLESRSVTRVEDRRDTLIQSRGRFNELRSKLTALESAAKNIGKASELRQFKTTSSDDTKVTVDASENATVGSFAIEVSELATAQSTAFAAPRPDPTDVLGGGTIDIDQGGSVTSIVIDPSADLYGVRDAINDSDAGVDASVIFDGNDYQLVVSAQEEGVANRFGITATGLGSAPGTDPLVGEELDRGGDAELTINGLEVTSSTNQVDQAIAGVSINLTDVTETNEAIQISIERDDDAIFEELESFVSTYNEAIDFIDAEGGSDISLRTARRAIERSVQTLLDDQSFGFTGLAQVGIENAGDGRLELDRSVFDDAIDSDFDAFVETFAGTEDGSADGFAGIFDLAFRGDSDVEGSFGILSPGDGTLASRETFINDRIRGYDDRISRLEERLVRFEERQVAKFAALEQLVAQFQAQGAALG